MTPYNSLLQPTARHMSGLVIVNPKGEPIEISARRLNRGVRHKFHRSGKEVCPG
jgi:hypothetical protein